MAARSGWRGSAAALALAALATACPSASPPPPQPIDEIVVAYPEEPPTLDASKPGGPSAAAADLRNLSGSFALSRWRRGLDMLFERAPGAPAPPGGARRIRIVFVPDATAALTLFRRGKIDVLGPYHAPDWSRRTAVPGVAGSTVAALLLSTSAVDAAARRALLATVPLHRIVSGIVGREGAAVGQQDARLDRGASAARALARGRHLRITLAFVAEQELPAVVARAIQYAARPAGLDVQPVALSPDAFWREWLPGRRFRAALVLARAPASAPAGAETVALYRVASSLVARPGLCSIREATAADGAFSNAAEWRAC